MFEYVWKKKLYCYQFELTDSKGFKPPSNKLIVNKLKTGIEAYLRSEDNDDTEKISTHKHYKIGKR